MNQGRIWCVVSPTVGLPLLLGSVAATSLIVHASIMSHTTWMSGYWAGSKGRVAAAETTSPQVASIAPQAGSGGFVITVAPGATVEKPFVITVAPTTAGPSGDGTVEQTGPLALAASPPK
jgi:light-harvesting protein B-800-850 alpha chain